MYFSEEQCTSGVSHSQTSYPQLTALQSGWAAAACVLQVFHTQPQPRVNRGQFNRKQPLGREFFPLHASLHCAIICQGWFPGTPVPAPRRGQVNEGFRPSPWKAEELPGKAGAAHTHCQHPAAQQALGKGGLQSWRGAARDQMPQAHSRLGNLKGREEMGKLQWAQVTANQPVHLLSYVTIKKTAFKYFTKEKIMLDLPLYGTVIR